MKQQRYLIRGTINAFCLAMMLVLGGAGSMGTVALAQPGPGDVGVNFIKFACPTVPANPYTDCDIVTGATFRIEADGAEIAGGPFTTGPTGLLPGFFFDAPEGATITVTELGGGPAGFVPAPGFDPLIIDVADIPIGGCGGESTCPTIEFINVPDPATSEPPVPTPTDQGAAALTIHHRVCPAGYTGPDFYTTCHDDPVDFWELFLRGPENRTAETDANGDATFPDLIPGTYGIRGGGGPTDLVDLEVFCARTADLGTEFPSTNEALQGGPGAFLVTLTLAEGDDILCDFYVIPADLGPVPTETPVAPTATSTPTSAPTTTAPPSPAVEADGRAATIFAGECGGRFIESFPVFTNLVDLVPAGGEAVGREVEAVPETSYTTVFAPLEDLVAEPHLIAISSAEDEQEIVACGDIAGLLTESGDLVIALRELGGSGFAGVAYISPGSSEPDQTGVSVFLVEGLAGGGDVSSAAMAATD